MNKSFNVFFFLTVYPPENRLGKSSFITNRRNVSLFFYTLGLLEKLKTGIGRCGHLSRFQWYTFQERISMSSFGFHPFSHRISYREKPGFIYLLVKSPHHDSCPSTNMARLLYKHKRDAYRLARQDSQ